MVQGQQRRNRMYRRHGHSDSHMCSLTDERKYGFKRRVWGRGCRLGCNAEWRDGSHGARAHTLEMIYVQTVRGVGKLQQVTHDSRGPREGKSFRKVKSGPDKSISRHQKAHVSGSIKNKQPTPPPHISTTWCINQKRGTNGPVSLALGLAPPCSIQEAASQRT